MTFRVHGDRLATRLAGTVVGLMFLLVGLYALFGGGDAVDAALRERARGFGVSAVIAALVAIPVSWLVRRLDDIWCSPPRKGWFNAKRRPGRAPDGDG
jgi:hypothetical protein